MTSTDESERVRLSPPAAPRTCSFCGKDESEVSRLVAGPTAFICNECVELSASVIIGPSARLTLEDEKAIRARADAATRELLFLPVEVSDAKIQVLASAIDSLYRLLAELDALRAERDAAQRLAMRWEAESAQAARRCDCSR